MTRLLSFLALCILLTGCSPTYKDWSRASDNVFQGYMTGDVFTAKAALLRQEKLVTEYEARGTRGVDFVVVRTVLYTQLCGVSDYMAQTNEARLYYQKYLAVSPNNTRTYAELIKADKKEDALLKPKWRTEMMRSNTSLEPTSTAH